MATRPAIAIDPVLTNQRFMPATGAPRYAPTKLGGERTRIIFVGEDRWELKS